MSPPWMPLYIADYRADTAHLSAAEHGAYLQLIMHYWTTGGLPDDDRQLARIACMTAAQWKASRSIVAAFFHDGWKHKRIEAELRRVAEVSASYAARARQAAEKRWAKHASSNASSIPQAMPEECLDMPSSHPQPHKKEPVLRTGRARTETPLPEGWKPSEADRAYARSKEWDEARIDREAERFANHAVSRGRRLRDWPAGWRNWVTSQYQEPVIRAGQVNGTDSKIIAAADRLLERIRGFDDPPDAAECDAGLRGGTGAAVVRMLPQRRSE